MANKLLQGLKKTRDFLTADIGDLIKGTTPIDDATLEELETRLLMADVGIETTDIIISALKKRASKAETLEQLMAELHKVLVELLEPYCQPLPIDSHKPFTILMIGINGSGKTTTTGKLAKQLQSSGLNVMLAAGDTFRAAAVEQIKVWGERNAVPVIAQDSGADSASVIFDALQSAQAKNVDVLLADTAGRLHTQDNLMGELEKIKRVLKKLDDTAPQETLLVLDASIGQNALQQAKKFHEAIGVSGIVLTKLDGTAKGGIIFAIAQQLELPIRYIGVGESIDDLRPFAADEFVEALLAGA